MCYFREFEVLKILAWVPEWWHRGAVKAGSGLRPVSWGAAFIAGSSSHPSSDGSEASITRASSVRDLTPSLRYARVR